MTKNYSDITLALAAIVQSSMLVNQLAFTGECDSSEFETAIYSIFQLSPKDVPQVFNGIEKLQTGLKEITNIFNRTKKPNPYINRCIISLLMIERLLARNKMTQKQIRRRLEHGQSQINYFSLTHESVIASLAETYLQTISTFDFRFQIIGKQSYLSDKTINQKIRAILLAGVRAAMLWRQVGGRRWQLIFLRQKILDEAKKNLEQIKKNEDVA